jgi:hypothetical protein
LIVLALMGGADMVSVVIRQTVVQIATPPEMRGRVWGRTVPKPDVAAWRASHDVLSAQLHAGRTRLRVLADAPPDEHFEPVEPDLEDVYFHALGGRGAAV